MLPNAEMKNITPAKMRLSLATPVGGEQSGDGRADDTSDEGTGTGEPVHAIGVGKIVCTHEKRLQTFLCTGNNGGVIAEE
jgi:hypothetical protein